MYSTLFTMPYLLVAHYHETDTIHCEDSWFLRQIRSLLASIKEQQGGGQEKVKESDQRKQAVFMKVLFSKMPNFYSFLVAPCCCAIG